MYEWHSSRPGREKKINLLREFSHPDWLPRRGIQRGIATLENESEALRDIALERQQNNNSKTIRNSDPFTHVFKITIAVHRAENKLKSF